MKKTIIYTLLLGALLSCNTHKNNFALVKASMETHPVKTPDDAADDACFWYNKKHPEASYIIGTNKKQGLVIYDLEGQILRFFPVGKVNNVAIRYDFSMPNGESSALMAASNRTNNQITLFAIDQDGHIQLLKDVVLQSQLVEVYGLGMYQNPQTKDTYVLITGKNGGLEQWKIYSENSKINGEIVRKGKLKSKAEGIVGDDENNKIYVAEEDVALWSFTAEPDQPITFHNVMAVKAPILVADFEGVTIYDKGAGEGYIILSSQGNNSYAVIDRKTNQYLNSFAIGDGPTTDGTEDTDGIDAIAFGTNRYPKGFFIAQDGSNVDGKVKKNQNFKIVSWEKIEQLLKE